ALSEEICELVLRFARENPRWGYQRIVGELAGIGVRVSATTVAKILRRAAVPPAGARARLSWRQFLCCSSLSLAAGGYTSPTAPAEHRQPAHGCATRHSTDSSPHPAVRLRRPTPERRLHAVSSHSPDRIHRRDRLGGLIHEYGRAA